MGLSMFLNEQSLLLGPVWHLALAWSDVPTNLSCVLLSMNLYVNCS